MSVGQYTTQLCFMSDYHKKRYLYLKEYLKVFKIPIIIFSSINSILSVGLQPYLEQCHISAMVAGISLVVLFSEALNCAYISPSLSQITDI